MNSYAAVLLCGGESRRMGRDKATMEWRGRLLWEWQLEKLRALEPSEIFVAARTDPPWRPSDTKFVADAAPSRGPLSGLAAALAASDADHLLVLAIDLPAMTIEHLQYLSGLTTPGVGVVPVIDGRAEPLVAVYPSSVRLRFATALTKKDVSLQPLIRELVDCGVLRTVAISTGTHLLYRNLNAPADLLD